MKHAVQHQIASNTSTIYN